MVYFGDFKISICTNSVWRKSYHPPNVNSGIAIDLDSGTIFPAEFPWNNFEDFSEQLKDRVSRRSGQGATLSDEDRCKTKLSTFKPKALRNPNTYKNLQSSSKDKDKKG